MTTLHDFARVLGCGRPGCPCVRPRGRRLVTHCPAHDDRHPSFGVDEKGGRLLWKCRAGCDQHRVTEALQEKALLERKDPERARQERIDYWSTRRERILAAVERGDLSQEAADWMLHGYQEERASRQREWQEVADELMAQCIARQEVEP